MAKGLPNSIFIDFLCNWHSISVCLQASARENGQPCTQSLPVLEFNKKKNTFQMNILSSSLFLFLSLFFLLPWCPLLSYFPLLNAFHPHFQTEACMVNITVCATRLSHRWLWEKKKNSTFHLSSWLESHLDKSSVFFWKKKKKAQTKHNSRWPCPRIHH